MACIMNRNLPYRSGVFIVSVRAASLEFTHRAMSLMSIRKSVTTMVSFIATDR